MYIWYNCCCCPVNDPENGPIEITSHPIPNNNLSYDQIVAECKAKGGRLATRKEVLDHRRGIFEIRYLQKLQNSDSKRIWLQEGVNSWTPVSDRNNLWIQVGDDKCCGHYGNYLHASYWWCGLVFLFPPFCPLFVVGFNPCCWESWTRQTEKEDWKIEYYCATSGKAEQQPQTTSFQARVVLKRGHVIKGAWCQKGVTPTFLI